MKLFKRLTVVILMTAGTVAAQELPLKTSWDTTTITQTLQAAQKVTLAGQIDSAEVLYLSTYKQSIALKYAYGIIKSQIGMGNIAINKGLHESALKHYHSALNFAQRTNAKILLTTIYNNIGNVYTLQGNYAKGATQYEQALAANKQYGSELHLETIYNNLSISLNKLGRPTQSLFYLSKAEALALESNNQISLADIYNNMGGAYNELGDTAKSIYYFNQAVTISRKNAYLNTLFSGLVNLGILYLNKNELQHSLRVLDEAGALQAQANNYYRNLFTLTGGAANLKAKHFQKAEKLLLQSLSLGQEIGNIKDLQTTHMLLAELYGKTQRYRQAFEHKSEELVLLDSIKRKEATQMVTEIESKYRTALKDEQLAKESLTISKQAQSIARKNRWIAMGFGSLFLISLFALIQRRNFRQKQRLKNEQLKNMEQRQKYMEMQAIMDGAEKERVRLSREIHDNLMVQFSVVKMNLSTYMHASQTKEAREHLNPVMEQLDMATDQLRHIAHNLMPDRINEDGLVEAVQFFCDAIHKSLPIHVNFLVIGTLPNLSPKFELSIYRIIQELMQNIIKHATASEAIVQLSFTDHYLSITVEDNGAGMPEGKTNEGLGLKSIAARVNEYKGRMHIDSTPGIGTTIQLEFHLQDIENS